MRPAVASACLLILSLAPPAAAQCDVSLAGLGQAPSDAWAYAIALQGDEAFVGAPAIFTQEIGSVTVLRRVGTEWQVADTLLPSDPKARYFGLALAVSGDRLVVGASNTDVGTNNLAGAVFVFERVAGQWTETAELVATDSLCAQLGTSVAVLGDRVLAGAPGTPKGGSSNAGAAYVFEGSGGAWSQTAKLQPSVATQGSELGTSVALAGDQLLVGGRGSNQPSGPAGMVLVHEQQPGGWTVVQQLTGEKGSLFALRMAVDGERLLVGAHLSDAPATGLGGAVHVYERSAGTWLPTATLLAQDPQDTTFFGASLALSGERVLVGSTFHGAGNGAGYVHVFELSAGTWEKVARLDAPGGFNPHTFGAALALQGETALVSWESMYTGFVGKVLDVQLGQPHVPFGAGVPGSGGLVPRLRGAVCHVDPAHPEVLLEIDEGLGGAAGALLWSATAGALPFVGGTLHVGPPIHLIFHVLGGAPGLAGAGALSASTPVPAGLLGSGLVIVAQAAYADPAAVKGWSLSRGLSIALE
jgi:FG-GAP repeat